MEFEKDLGILTAEAGITLDAILDFTLPKGFFLPVTPGTMHVTLGGALASNVHGKNHHHTGSIENFVMEIMVDTPKGIITCTRNADENADLFFATLGGYGLTGCILSAKIKMLRVENSSVMVKRICAKNLQQLFELFSFHDKEYAYSVAWIDCLAKGKGLGRGVLMLGNHKGGNGQKLKVPSKILPIPFSIPFAMPSFFLNRFFISLFNALFYWKSILSEKFSLKSPGNGKVEDYQKYFYPLDKIEKWNLLYGKRGFFQYQCMIPDPHAEKGIAECLNFLSENGLGAFLSVLKRCGDDTVALPFCKRGYTLALDIPYRGRVTEMLLDQLDEVVLRFQGKVYLTKDARLSPKTFRAMYPESKAWMQTVKKYNPEKTCNSMLADRLELWKA